MLRTGDPRSQASPLLKGGSVWWIYNVRVIIERNVTVNACARAFCTNMCFVLRHWSLQSFSNTKLWKWKQLNDFLVFIISLLLENQRWICGMFPFMCKRHIPLHMGSVLLKNVWIYIKNWAFEPEYAIISITSQVIAVVLVWIMSSFPSQIV